MNSKERIKAAISRKPVDEIPLGFYAVDYDIIEKVIGRKTYVRNKIEIKLALADGRRDEVAESFKKDTVEFYKKIDCADIIIPKEAALLPPKDYEPVKMNKIEENKYKDEHGRIWEAVPDVNEIMCMYDPLLEESNPEFETSLDIIPPDNSVFEAIDYVIEQLGDEKYIASYLPFNVMPQQETFGNFEEAILSYITNPELIKSINYNNTKKYNRITSNYIRPGTEGAFIEQDMAGSNAPFISPDMFRKLCLPYFKERVKEIKKYTDQLIFHNCGNNISLMEMFIDAGVNCYQSLQTTAGMEVDKLKNLFGDYLSFWGGVPVELLIGGTTAEVKKAVQIAMEKGAQGSGFILGPSHSIAKNTKYDNFMAMIDEYSRLKDKYR